MMGQDLHPGMSERVRDGTQLETHLQRRKTADLFFSIFFLLFPFLLLLLLLLLFFLLLPLFCLFREDRRTQITA
jgi:hypothetical protein